MRAILILMRVFLSQVLGDVPGVLRRRGISGKNAVANTLRNVVSILALSESILA